jgi:hypothetical protein
MSPIWTREHALEAGYQLFFGPCHISEGRMIDIVMDDALRNLRDVVIVGAQAANRGAKFWVYKRKLKR